MTSEFRQAKRSGVKLMVGLAGPSGCGKTYSALLLAKGIQEVDGGDIYAIDTENRRSEHYADMFDFKIGELHAPFNPKSYLKKIEAAYAAGGRIIIVDSGSHMHEGEGGILDMHDKLLDKWCGEDEKKRDKNNMRAWIEPKRELGMVVNRLLQIDAHFIFCFRAQEKLKPVSGGQPKSLGIQPIASERLSYEMTMRLVLPGVKKGVPDLDAEATKLPEPIRPMMKDDARITPDLGWMLAKWARGDEEQKKPAAPAAITKKPDQAQPSSPAASDQAQPSSPDAPDSEAPPAASHAGGAATLAAYHLELTGAVDADDLAARHDGSENFGKLNDAEKDKARAIYRLHLQRVRGQVTRDEYQARSVELLEGVLA